MGAARLTGRQKWDYEAISILAHENPTLSVPRLAQLYCQRVESGLTAKSLHYIKRHHPELFPRPEGETPAT